MSDSTKLVDITMKVMKPEGEWVLKGYLAASVFVNMETGAFSVTRTTDGLNNLEVSGMINELAGVNWIEILDDEEGGS